MRGTISVQHGTAEHSIALGTLEGQRNHRMPSCSRLVSLTLAWTWLLVLWALPSHAAVSVNLTLDDPAYPLLEKLVRSNLTFANALTIKPITRLYAARLVAEAIQHRRQEWDASQRQDRFIDQTLQYLAGRFKRELRQIGFYYQPRRPGALVLTAVDETKFDLVGAHNQFVLRDVSGLTSNLQGVFEDNEGFVPGDGLSVRLRSTSWATLWDILAAYLEPDLIARTDALLDTDTFDIDLHKGYLKASYVNLELEFGRDTFWWGPALQGDLVLSNNALPLDVLKLSTPLPFRLPWVYGELGAWQIAYFVTRLEADRAIPHALLSGLRITFQPTSYLQVGYSNVFQAFGEGGVSVNAGTYVKNLLVPSLEAEAGTVNGLMAFDVVLTLPFVRDITFLHGVQFYWQRGLDNDSNVQGLLGGGNILGGVLDGGRWDLRVEFAETRDHKVWYTHPTYASGYSYRSFILGHPIGGTAESLFGRATYYLTPTTWFAADGRREQYGFGVQPEVTTQFRLGLTASHQLVLKQQRHLVLQSRFEYATLDRPSFDLQRSFSLTLSARWWF
jgi:hypothetical protein